MRSLPLNVLCSAATLAIAAPLIAGPAMAASADYLLIIDGVDGEVSSATRVAGWSFNRPVADDISNQPTQADTGNLGSSGQDGVSKRESPSRPRIVASQNSQSLRESPTRPSSGGTAVAVGDLDDDGLQDLRTLARVDEITGFSLSLPQDSDVARRMCAGGKHFTKAHLVNSNGVVYDLTELKIGACTAGSGEARGFISVPLTGSMRGKGGRGHVTLMK